MLLTLSACASVTPSRTPTVPRAAPPAKPPVARPPTAKPRPAAPAQSTTTPVPYSCKAGKRFTATYPAKGDRAVVSAGGLTKALPLARSASGARYAEGVFELWGKGDAATLTGFPGGPYAACQAH